MEEPAFPRAIVLDGTRPKFGPLLWIGKSKLAGTKGIVLHAELVVFRVREHSAQRDDLGAYQSMQ